MQQHEVVRLRLSRGLRQRLEAEMRERDMTMSALIRDALYWYYKTNPLAGGARQLVDSDAEYGRDAEDNDEAI